MRCDLMLATDFEREACNCGSTATVHATSTTRTQSRGLQPFRCHTLGHCGGLPTLSDQVNCLSPLSGFSGCLWTAQDPARPPGTARCTQRSTPMEMVYSIDINNSVCAVLDEDRASLALICEQMYALAKLDWQSDGEGMLLLRPFFHD